MMEEAGGRKMGIGRRLLLLALVLVAGVLVATALRSTDSPSKSSAAGTAAATAPPPPSTTVTFTPAVIAMEAAEIPNPMRGQYEWLGQGPQPPAWPPHLDTYDRMGWYELEPSQGQYDFSRIDRMLERAASSDPPRRHSIAVMTAMSCCDSGQADWNGGVQVPEYVKERSNGVTVRLDGPPSFWPDWNDEFYLSRWEALMDALGERYREDERFGYMDIRGYGNYGEWHLQPGPRYPGPEGQQDITTASAVRLVDAAVNAFSDGSVLLKTLVMLTPRDDALRHALGRSTRVGVRGDCLGGELGPAGGYIAAEDHPARSRWQTAPFVTEWCGNEGTEDQFRRAARDVVAYHVATVSSGNIDNVGDPPSEAYQQAIKMSGYRIELNALSILGVLEAGEPVTVATSWSNSGVTPAYDEWDVTFQLRNRRTGATVHAGRSTLDLRALLPTGGVPVSMVDSFVVPAKVKPGSYDVAVLVRDPSEYLAPLRLAVEGRAEDGSYVVGTVRVR